MPVNFLKMKRLADPEEDIFDLYFFNLEEKVQSRYLHKISSYLKLAAFHSRVPQQEVGRWSSQDSCSGSLRKKMIQFLNYKSTCTLAWLPVRVGSGTITFI